MNLSTVSDKKDEIINTLESFLAANLESTENDELEEQFSNLTVDSYL